MLESNAEMTYYLNQFYDGPDMVYTLIKSMRPLWDSIRSCYPLLREFYVYTDSDVLLFDAFRSLDTIPLSDEKKEMLLSSDFREIFWREVPSGTSFPSFFSYQKVYNKSYSKCIGYLEICYDDILFTNMLDSMEEILYNSQADCLCFYEGRQIYGPEYALPENTLPENGLKTDWLHNSYYHSITLKNCGLQIVFAGKLSSVLFHPSDIFPVFMITLLVFLLLFCSLLFFRIIHRISGRIYSFSSFLNRTSNGELEIYPSSGEEKFAEIDALIHSYNNLISKNKALTEKMVQMEILTQEARYQALQSQIHPHFIYGTLETIRMLALSHQDFDSASMIYSLSSLMRQSVEIGTNASTLEKELSIVQDYMDIQQIRFSGRLVYQVQTDPTLFSLELPSFTLQPIVENAIVYGISQTLEAGKIIVKAERHASTDTIRLCVLNSGKPIDPNRLADVNALLCGQASPNDISTRGNGVALYNILQRLRFLYSDRISMQMESQDGWTQTTIILQE